MPEAIVNAPELQFELEIYWEAYTHLMTCRPAAWAGLMPIPWDAIQRYADACHFDADQASNLHLFSRKMDEALMKREKAKNGTKKGRGG